MGLPVTPPEVRVTLSVPVTISYARALALIRPSGPFDLFFDEEATAKALEDRLSTALTKILADCDKDITRINLGEIDIPPIIRHAIAFVLDEDGYRKDRLPASPEACAEYLRLYLSREYWEILADVWSEEASTALVVRDGYKQLRFKFPEPAEVTKPGEGPIRDGRSLRGRQRDEVQWQLNYLVHEKMLPYKRAIHFARITEIIGKQLIVATQYWPQLKQQIPQEFLAEMASYYKTVT